MTVNALDPYVVNMYNWSAEVAAGVNPDTVAVGPGVNFVIFQTHNEEYAKTQGFDLHSGDKRNDKIRERSEANEL